MIFEIAGSGSVVLVYTSIRIIFMYSVWHPGAFNNTSECLTLLNVVLFFIFKLKKLKKHNRLTCHIHKVFPYDNNQLIIWRAWTIKTTENCYFEIIFQQCHKLIFGAAQRFNTKWTLEPFAAFLDEKSRIIIRLPNFFVVFFFLLIFLSMFQSLFLLFFFSCLFVYNWFRLVQSN